MKAKQHIPAAKEGVEERLKREYSTPDRELRGVYRGTVFKGPRVGALLGGSAKSLGSCHYPYPNDRRIRTEMHKQLIDLGSSNTFNHRFKTLLGEGSDWEFPGSRDVEVRRKYRQRYSISASGDSDHAGS